MRKFLTLLSLVWSLSLGAQNIIYVEPGGMGTGMDPMNATDLNTALSMVSGNGMSDTIRMVEGVYTATPYILNLAGSDGMEIIVEGGWDATFENQNTWYDGTILDGSSASRVFDIVGAPSANGVQVTLQYFTISNGMVDNQNGAGLRIDGGELANIHTILNRVRFVSNVCPTAGSGGGMASNCSYDMQECVFDNNEAYNGGGLYSYYTTVTEGIPRTIDNSEFNSNFNYGNQGSTIWTNNQIFQVTDSNFAGTEGNSMGPGSCLWGNTGAGLYVDRCRFSYIEIQYWGSAIQTFDGDIYVSNSLFHNNKAGTSSGYGTIAYYHNLGAVDRTIQLVNNTFVNNTTGAVLYSGVHFRGNGSDQCNIYNTVFWGTSGSPLYAESGSANIGNCVSNSAPINFTEDTPTVLMNPGLDQNFQFDETSNLYDGGSNDWVMEEWTDKDGNKRVLGDAVDIGCYELNLAPTGVSIIDDSLDENEAFSTLLGAEGQAGDTHTFELAMSTGAEDEHNELFEIDNGDVATLNLLEPVNYEEIPELHIYLRVTDSYGHEYETAATLAVNDVNEAPVFDGMFDDQSGTETVYLSFTQDLSGFSDVDAEEELTISATLDDDSALPSWLTFDYEDGGFYGTPTENGTWTIKVTAADQGGLTASGTFELDVLPFISVNEIHALKLQLFPNPTYGVLMIQGDLKAMTPYRVTDLSGRLLLEGSLNTSAQPLDVSGLAPGNYILNLIHDGRISGLHFSRK